MSTKRKYGAGAAKSLAAYTHWNTDEIEPVNGHDGMLHTADYKDAIGMGKVAGHSKFRGFGRRDSLATTTGGDDLSDISAVAIPWPNQSVGEQMTIVSTSANDTAAGSGARTVKVHYINAAGAYLHETVTLNGTTGVNTVATDIRFVQMITVDSLGSFGGKNAGLISIYKLGDPTTVYASIAAGGNISLGSARMVPAGKNFYLSNLVASATSTKPISVRLTATCDHSGTYTEGVFQFEEIVELEDTAISIIYPVPIVIPSLAIIKGIAISSTAGGSASVSYGGWIE